MIVKGYKASVLVREMESREKALKEAESFRNCPRLLVYGFSGNKIVSVYMAPDEEDWWLNYSELFPNAKAESIMIDEVIYPPQPREVVASEKPPCGADCAECPFVEEKGCKGCIATR